MRLFAALPVSGGALAELTRLIEEFRQEDWSVRWVSPAGLHLTVKFLGGAERGQLPAIGTALRAACAGTPTLSLAPRDIGAFPGFAGARVLWAGYHGEPELELLAHRVEQGIARLGFPAEGRPFSPHVTIGRLRERGVLSPEAVHRLEQGALREGFIADRLVLYDSVTGAGGAVYTALDTILLGT